MALAKETPLLPGAFYTWDKGEHFEVQVMVLGQDPREDPQGSPDHWVFYAIRGEPSIAHLLDDNHVGHCMGVTFRDHCTKYTGPAWMTQAELAEGQAFVQHILAESPFAGYYPVLEPHGQ